MVNFSILNENFNSQNYFLLNYFEIMKDVFKFTALNSDLRVTTMKGVFSEFRRMEEKNINDFE